MFWIKCVKFSYETIHRKCYLESDFLSLPVLWPGLKFSFKFVRQMWIESLWESLCVYPEIMKNGCLNSAEQWCHWGSPDLRKSLKRGAQLPGTEHYCPCTTVSRLSQMLSFGLCLAFFKWVVFSAVIPSPVPQTVYFRTYCKYCDLLREWMKRLWVRCNRSHKSPQSV